LHRAAYRELGLPWTYDAIEMTSDRLEPFLAGLGSEWRGFSLTMPVKHALMPLLDERHERVRLTGVCNTVLLDGARRRGFNTDIHGIVAAFREAGVVRSDHVQVLGGGATASSAIVAAAELGAARVTVSARSPQRALPLADLGPMLGILVEIEQLGDPLEDAPDAIISTLPNGADAGLHFDARLRREAVLLDVAYDPWPSPLAQRWREADGLVISGLEMLLHQAVVQIRIFTDGDPDVALPGEGGVIAAMRSALGAASESH
jgi:shikimate dehydrogenase